MKLLLVSGIGEASNQLESISSLFNTRILFSPNVFKLSQICSQNRFNILHIIGYIKPNDKGEFSQLYFRNNADEFITPEQLSNLIKLGSFDLVFLSCENSALFASEISNICDCVFLAKPLTKDSLWEFPLRFYTFLHRLYTEEKILDIRRSFRQTNYSNSGYGYISKQSDLYRSINQEKTTTLVFDVKSSLVLIIVVLITLFGISISFVSFLLGISNGI